MLAYKYAGLGLQVWMYLSLLNAVQLNPIISSVYALDYSLLIASCGQNRYIRWQIWLFVLNFLDVGFIGFLRHLLTSKNDNENKLVMCVCVCVWHGFVEILRYIYIVSGMCQYVRSKVNLIHI